MHPTPGGLTEASLTFATGEGGLLAVSGCIEIDPGRVESAYHISPSHARLATYSLRPSALCAKPPGVFPFLLPINVGVMVCVRACMRTWTARI